MAKQRRRCPFEHPEDFEKAIGPAVPRVGDIVLDCFGVEVACEDQAFRGEGTERLDERPVVPVHGDDEVELQEVLFREWSRALMADRETMARGNFDAPEVGWFAPVKRRGPRAVNVELPSLSIGLCGCLQQAFENGRATDVSFAEDQRMNDSRFVHQRLLLLPIVATATLAAGCVRVQTHSFLASPAPDRLPELAYDEVRRGRYADHADLLGPVQITMGPRDTAEFPVILEKGQCYQAIAVEENRRAPLRIAFLDEEFGEKDAAPAVRGAATIFRCAEAPENLILSIEGMQEEGRVVVGVVLRPK